MATVSVASDDVNPSTAYYMLLDNPNTYILDVRTPAEWNWVGHPGVEKCYETTCGAGDPVSERGGFLEGKVINIPFKLWVFDPETKEYVEELNKFFDEEVVRQFSPDDTIIIMCRSGSRSKSAWDELEDPTHPAYKRLEELGFYNLYNMVGGFEGGTDKCCYRKKEAGWKNMGLPYNYSTEGIWIPQQKGRSLEK
jgi:rhodanese-related sulfurtransferase